MIAWMNRHPDMTTWIVLAIGMLAALTWSARNEGLAAMQWTWLALAVTGVSGLCAWIISWEADTHDDDGSESGLAEDGGVVGARAAAERDIEAADGSATAATSGALE